MERLIELVEKCFIHFTNRKLVSLQSLPTLPMSEGLGIGIEDGEPFELTSQHLAKHAYILGATGCGKTSLILKLIEQDIKRHHTITVIDLRGDLIHGTLSICANLQVPSDRVCLLDLRSKDVVQGFNPLSGAGEAYIKALHVLEVVQGESDSWGVQLEESLRSALLLLAESGKGVADIERVFYDTHFRASCLSHCTDESVASFWQRYESLSDEKQQTWTLPVLNKVTPLLASPVLRKCLGADDPLNLNTVLSTPGKVFLISLAVDELHRSGKMLGSLLVSAISREMMARVNVAEKDRNPTRLYVDEFENMASESFEGLIAEGRRFGLTLVLSHQTLSQLPMKLRSVIRNNVGIQVIFQCGYEDARHIARELPDDIEAVNLRALEVGQAFVMDRDGSARLIQFNPPPTPAAPLILSAYRRSILKRIPAVASKAQSIPSDPVMNSDLEDWL